ncbi:MAG: hypothetical protein ABIK73_06970 [candidate division WOR-3 bacterium]
MKVLYRSSEENSAVVLGDSGALFLLTKSRVKELDPILFATWMASVVGLDAGVTEEGWQWLQAHMHLVRIETPLN